MRRLFVCALTAALALPAQAQQQSPTITLSCNGTIKLTAAAAAEFKPDPITNLGVIVNVIDRTVTFLDYVVPITGASATLISFSGQQTPVLAGAKLKSFTIVGAIDRITGQLTIDWWYENVGNNTAWELSCRPASRMF